MVLADSPCMEHLGKTIRVKLNDGRTIYGQLICFNRGLDLILNNSIEQHIQKSTRYVGMVVVPGKILKSISLQHL